MALDREPAILDTVAAAHAKVGLFLEAVKAVRVALNLAAELKQQPLVQTLTNRLALYEAKSPLRGMLVPPQR